MSLAKRKHFQKPNCVTVLAFLQTTEEPAKFLEELEPLTLQKKTPLLPGQRQRRPLVWGAMVCSV